MCYLNLWMMNKIELDYLIIVIRYYIIKMKKIWVHIKKTDLCIKKQNTYKCLQKIR